MVGECEDRFYISKRNESEGSRNIFRKVEELVKNHRDKTIVLKLEYCLAPESSYNARTNRRLIEKNNLTVYHSLDIPLIQSP